ncbi:hypothetical protein [Shewanella marina]|nr:hypothetical protein [Shewanella marina]
MKKRVVRSNMQARRRMRDNQVRKRALYRHKLFFNFLQPQDAPCA